MKPPGLVRYLLPSALVPEEQLWAVLLGWGSGVRVPGSGSWLEVWGCVSGCSEPVRKGESQNSPR